MMLPIRFLLLFAMMELLVQTAVVTIPWKSSLLQDGNSFTAKLGDVLVFDPCGDSNGTNLVYTTSKDAYEDCRPATLSKYVYFLFSECINPRGSLTVTVNQDLIGPLGIFYFLSDYDSECENGLKAVVTVSPDLLIPPPVEDSPISIAKSTDYGTLSTSFVTSTHATESRSIAILSTPAGDGSDEPVAVPIVSTASLVAGSILVAAGAVVSVTCYYKQKPRKDVINECHQPELVLH